MTEKRERLDVISDILNAVIRNNNKIGPTRLIQLSNLSPAMFKEYIKHLTSNDLLLISELKGKKFYSITDKGYVFLEKYKNFKKFVNEIGI